MKLITAILIMLAAQAMALADLKVTTRNISAGQPSESTIYIKGQRQRTEDRNMTSVYQCDLRRIIYINDRTRKYFISPLDNKSGTPAVAADVPATPRTARRGGVVTYTLTVTDTGERKQMFGYTARHILTSMIIDAPEGTCNPGHTEMETDGWYIDLSLAFNCSDDGLASPPRVAPSGCQDEIRYSRKGRARLGFPVLVKTKMKLAGEDEQMDPQQAAMMERMMTSTEEVTDISQATLDAALFDVPAGYAKASSMSELYSFADDLPQGASVSDRNPSIPSPNNKDAPRVAVPAKREGVVRIGVATIKDHTGRGLSVESLRQTLVTNISAANVEAVPLSGDSASAAQQMQCDFILYTDLISLKASKVGGIFGRVTGIDVPGAEKFEARVEFRLLAVNSTSPQLQSSATAKENGAEASVAAALVKEAQTVATTAARKRN